MAAIVGFCVVFLLVVLCVVFARPKGHSEDEVYSHGSMHEEVIIECEDEEIIEERHSHHSKKSSSSSSSSKSSHHS